MDHVAEMLAGVDTYSWLGTLSQDELDSLNEQMPLEYWNEHKDTPAKLQEWLDAQSDDAEQG